MFLLSLYFTKHISKELTQSLNVQILTIESKCDSCFEENNKLVPFQTKEQGVDGIYFLD